MAPMTRRTGRPTAGRDGFDWVAEVKARLRILEIAQQYTRLRRSGESWRGPCPLHGGEGPNFSVVPAKQHFTCFVCGEKGNAVDLVMKKEGLDFLSAIKQLAPRVGIEVPALRVRRDYSADERARMERQASFTLTAGGPTGWEALGLDGLTERFQLGQYDDAQRTVLVLPVTERPGTPPVGWIRYRVVDGTPVREGLDPMSASVTLGILFQSDRARATAKLDGLVVVDDPVTVLRLAGLHVPAVAPVSPAACTRPEGILTDAECELLREWGVTRVTFWVPLGGPHATRLARLRAVYVVEPWLVHRGIEPCIVWAPPDVLANASHGCHTATWHWMDAAVACPITESALRRPLREARELYECRVKQLLPAIGPGKGKLGRADAVAKLAPTLHAARQLADPLLYHAYLAWTARELRFRDRLELVRLLERRAV